MTTVIHVFRQLDAWFPANATCNTGSVRLGPFSLVDPDVFVLDVDVALDPDDAVPAEAVKLVVEVSVTSHSCDRGPTLIAYARAGVPEVWLIDPTPDAGELVRFTTLDGASYRTVERLEVGENAATLDVSAIAAR
jgi:Uma2 family endonuclease